MKGKITMSDDGTNFAAGAVTCGFVFIIIICLFNGCNLNHELIGRDQAIECSAEILSCDAETHIMNIKLLFDDNKLDDINREEEAEKAILYFNKQTNLDNKGAIRFYWGYWERK